MHSTHPTFTLHRTRANGQSLYRTECVCGNEDTATKWPDRCPATTEWTATPNQARSAGAAHHLKFHRAAERLAETTYAA